MNHKRSFVKLFVTLAVFQMITAGVYAGFFEIDSVTPQMSQPPDMVGVWNDQLNIVIPAPVLGFMPSLEVRLRTQESISCEDVYVRGYFYDKNGKLIHSFSSPSNAGRIDNCDAPMPGIFKKGQQSRVFFELPKDINADNCRAVIVFGDTNEAVAMGYPDRFSTASLEYPEKKLVEDQSLKHIERKPAVDPVVEFVAKTGPADGRHPQVTLFLRMPKGVSDPSQLQGVLTICVLWSGLDVARNEMRQPEMGGDYKGLFAFANKHKLAIIAWGGPGTSWDSHKNYDQMNSRAELDMDDALNAVADAWEYGVQQLAKQYNLPTKDYLLWGLCGGAQWAQRLCLRKPNYFLATYMLIPGSFDKPTPEANRVLWCLCTGELYGGYDNARAWYKECSGMGYPMIFKAYEGLGHAISQQAVGMSYKFFDFALTQKEFRDNYDRLMASRISSFQLASAGKTPGTWIESFKHPSYYGDIVNQEVFPSNQVDMIPPGFRTPLPTKELADYWNLSQ